MTAAETAAVMIKRRRKHRSCRGDVHGYVTVISAKNHDGPGETIMETATIKKLDALTRFVVLRGDNGRRSPFRSARAHPLRRDRDR
jgi:hypothetical protein